VSSDPIIPKQDSTEYNLACNAALRGRKDGAIAFLEQAIEDGMRPTDMLNIQQDDDLKSLRGDPCFDAIVKAARERAAAVTAVLPASE
jgi:hypothetical protein